MVVYIVRKQNHPLSRSVGEGMVEGQPHTKDTP